MATETIRVFAPAKINLALHVVGRRRDGYHLLDSLVAFAPVGDWLSIGKGTESQEPRLSITGPEAAGLAGAGADAHENLVLRAARLMGASLPLRFALEKHLPVASGIGGGSADAAAALRGIVAYLGAEMPPLNDVLKLGADVPMCLSSAPCRVSGIGERISPLGRVPALPAVLVNPRVPVATPAVFAALQNADNPPMPDLIPHFETGTQMVRWLQNQRNDLQEAAIGAYPAVGKVLDAVSGCQAVGLARMSGSGGTVFGLFSSARDAQGAAQRLRVAHPDWWVKDTVLADQQTAARPRLN